VVDKETVVRAWREGRSAELRTPNPYYGTGLLARMWMRGYMAMLGDRMARSPARQKFLAREAAIQAFVERNGYRPAAVDHHLRG
jgi:hypothetical protein